MDNKDFNRRRFLSQLGLTVGTGIISTSFKIPFADNISDECKETPILELGPYAVMKYRKQADHDIDLTQIEGNSHIADGQIITVFGKITDKYCNPLKFAIVEIWQANHYGKYHHEYDKSEYKDDPNFQGWGQAITNEQGEYKFKTIYPAPYGGRARHIHFKVSRRDYHELTTQLFFEGEERNAKDPILSIFTHQEQQQLTRPLTDKDNAKQVEFNLVLDKVQKGVLPTKVLKEYTGSYFLKNAPYDMQAFMKRTMNIDVNDFDFNLTQKEGKLFMTLSFYPTIECVWVSKDMFQSWSFTNTFIKFTRDDKGKVVGLRLHFNEDDYVEAPKKNNR